MLELALEVLYFNCILPSIIHSPRADRLETIASNDTDHLLHRVGSASAAEFSIAIRTVAEVYIPCATGSIRGKDWRHVYGIGVSGHSSIRSAEWWEYSTKSPHSNPDSAQAGEVSHDGSKVDH